MTFYVKFNIIILEQRIRPRVILKGEGKMNIPTAVRVYERNGNEIKAFDDERMIELYLDNSQDMTEEQKERLSHVDVGSFLLVIRDSMGNIKKVSPLPMYKDYVKVLEKDPKPEPEHLVEEAQKAWDIS